MALIDRFPGAFEVAYDLTLLALSPFEGRVHPGGRLERLFVIGEKLTKGPLFDCRMCGQCVLHSTAMTCPMTCPKSLRNGPCGGVRENGHCEIEPDMRCIWVEAWARSERLPRYGPEIRRISPPLSRHLAGTSAWINELDGVTGQPPAGWDG
jgi:Methylene-tetrahydrofolate reductase C terminal